jgi:hypothetical protein
MWAHLRIHLTEIQGEEKSRPHDTVSKILAASALHIKFTEKLEVGQGNLEDTLSSFQKLATLRKPWKKKGYCERRGYFCWTEGETEWNEACGLVQQHFNSWYGLSYQDMISHYVISYEAIKCCYYEGKNLKQKGNILSKLKKWFP